MTYTKEIKPPKTMKDGLCNFIQMIINAAESGDSREAMLLAVDLLGDIQSGDYDTNIVDENALLIDHLEKEKIKAEKLAISEYARGVRDGAIQKQREIAVVLGL